MAVTTQTQAPSQPSTTLNGVSGLVSPTKNSNGGLTIKGSAQTNAVDQIMSSLHDNMGRSEVSRDTANQPQHGEIQVNGRSNSQSGPPPLDPTLPLTPGQQTQSQVLQQSRRPGGPPAPVQHIEERTLTVKRPDPVPQTSDAPEVLSGDKDESSNEGGMNDESSNSDEMVDLSSSPVAPPRTPTEPIRSKPTGASHREGRGAGHHCPESNPPIYTARNMHECKNLIEDLEMHFSKLSQILQRRGSQSSNGRELSQCPLLSRLGISTPYFIPTILGGFLYLSRGTRLEALDRYNMASQMPGQSVVLFAMYMAQYAAYANRMDNRSLHFWERIDTRLKGWVGRIWRNFNIF